MTSRIPKRLKNFGLMIQGLGYAGLCSGITLPDFKIKTDEIRNGGMDVPVDDDLGQEKMDITFKLQENNIQLLRLWGLQDGTNVRLLFRGGMSDGGASPVIQYEVEAHGKLMGIATGEVKSGEPNEPEYTLNVRYIRILANGREELKIDALAFERVVGGKDQLREMRQAIEV